LASTRSRTGAFALVVALVLLVGAGWFISDEPRSSSGAEVRPVSSEDASGAYGIAHAPTMVEALESVATDSASESDATREPVEQGSRSATRRPGPLKWFDGLVVPPEGAPADEALTVLVGYPQSVMSGDSEMGLESYEVDRVPVDDDGRFRFSCPADAEECALMLEARWLRLAGPQSVDLDARDTVVVLRPEIGARLRVVVRAPDGAPDSPLAALCGELSLSPNDALYAEDRDGAEDFVVGQPIEIGPLGASVGPVEVRAHGFEPFEYVAPPLLTGVVNELEIPLPLRAWVSGRVRDVNGSPVGYVEVTLQCKERRVRKKLKTWCGVDGQFHFFGAPTDVDLRLSVDSSAHLRVESLELGTLRPGERLEQLEFFLDTGGVLAGRVLTPSGEPAAFARVSAEPLELEEAAEPGSTRSVTCDDAGRFRITRLRRAAHRLTVLHRDDAGVGRTHKAIFERVEFGEELELTVERTLAVAGRVADANGVGLSEFRVRATAVRLAGAADSAPQDEVVSVSATRAHDGGFHLEHLLPGEWRIEVSARGFSSEPPRLLTLPRDAGSLNFRLEKLARVSGVAVDTAGLPLGRVAIRTRAAGSSETPRLAGVCEVDGTFGSFYVPLGAIELLARGKGHELEQPLELRLAPGEHRELRLVLVKR